MWNSSMLKRLAICALLLPAASCVVDEATQEPNVAHRGFALTVDKPPCLNTHWGDIKVTFEAGSFVDPNSIDPCKLFDGDTQSFAVIGGDGPGRTKIDLQFLQGTAR